MRKNVFQSIAAIYQMVDDLPAYREQCVTIQIVSLVVNIKTWDKLFTILGNFYVGDDDDDDDDDGDGDGGGSADV